jgi:pterin-4a-carbinolamine dehydratase
MNDYFQDTKFNLQESSLGKSLPIEPKKNTWEKLESPERIRKTFNLSSSQNLQYFVEDLIQFQDEKGHWGKILIDGASVTVQFFTKTVERVTELDIESAKKVDQIYDSVER